MAHQPWYRSWPIMLLLCLLLPPLALILVWVRPDTGVLKRLALTLPALILSGLYLIALTDLRLELDGSGIRPLLSRYDAESHFDELEASRQTQPPASAETPGNRSEWSEDAPWTDFRGPRRDGRFEGPINTSWPSNGLPTLWRQPIGGGYASFVVADGRAFTIEQRRHQEVVTAYDVETGRELWNHPGDAHFTEALGGDGPRATPTWNEGHLYALGATGELQALTADRGALLWRRNILEDNQAANLHWAMSASPLVADDRVIVLPGGTSGRSVVAYDKATGEPIWRALDDVQGYTSPMLVTLAGVRQLLVVTALRALGMDLEDGSVLWDYPWVVTNVPNITQPVLLGNDRIFLSASYGKGAAAIQVAATNGSFSAETLWETTRMKNKQSASVLHQGHLYGLDERVLACLDATTGELRWKGGRYGYGQLLLADGHLVILAESGDVALVRATPEGHDEVARFSAIDGKTWNSPVIAGGRLLVRNTTEMAAFDISRQSSVAGVSAWVVGRSSRPHR